MFGCGNGNLNFFVMLMASTKILGHLGNNTKKPFFSLFFFLVNIHVSMRLTSHYLTIYFFLLYFSQSHHQQTPHRPPTSDLKIPAPTLSTPSKRWVAKNVPSPPNDGAARTYLRRSSWRTTIVRTSGRSHIHRRSCRSDTAIVSRRNGSSVGYLVAENTNMWTFIMTRNRK